MSFLTLEDINTILLQYKNRPFWNETVIVTSDATDFTNQHFNYLKVSRAKSGDNYVFTIQVENELRTGNYYFLDSDDNWISATYSDGIITVTSPTKDITVYCELWVNSTTQTSFHNVEWIIEEYTPKKLFKGGRYTLTFTLKPVNENFTCNGKTFQIRTSNATCSNNKISINYNFENYTPTVFYVSYDGVRYDTPIIVNKKINVAAVANDLTVGKVNTFTLESQSSNLLVESDYPVTNTGKDVSLDLTGKSDLKPVTLTVHTLTDTDYVAGTQTFNVTCNYQQISNATELTSLFTNGGIGELTDHISLDNNVTINKNVHLKGNGYRIENGSNSIIVAENKRFKVEHVRFLWGNPTILQKANSTVEASDCIFQAAGYSGNNKLGTVIKCDIDLDSLNITDDFTTIITDSEIVDNFYCTILHGGTLVLSNTFVRAKVLESEYPYCLYQVDGEAEITNCSFRHNYEYRVPYDCLFNPAIFCIGETAIINHGSYADYGRNDVTGFLNNNTSTIDVTYPYTLIGEDITLQTENGYCHMVSGVDYLFKTNVTPRRVE